MTPGTEPRQAGACGFRERRAGRRVSSRRNKAAMASPDAEATKMAWGAVKVSSARGAAPLVGATEKVVFADNALRGSGKP